jgi:hypothetical protein
MQLCEEILPISITIKEASAVIAHYDDAKNLLRIFSVPVERNVLLIESGVGNLFLASWAFASRLVLHFFFPKMDFLFTMTYL